MTSTKSKGRMDDFYLYISSRDCVNIRKNNSPSDCWIQFPRAYTLEGEWVCALKEISLTCNFKPKSTRLYLCCDILEESYVGETSLPVLKNVEIQNKYQKLLSVEFANPSYVTVNVTSLNTLRLYLLDERLQIVKFDSNDLHCVLHLKKKWVP